MNDFNDSNWFSLEQAMNDDEKPVIPIIGPDALMVELEQSGSKVTELFYSLVTADLLKKFDIEPQPEILEHTWSLYKAATFILANKSSPRIERELQREISRLINYYSQTVQPAESLRMLVGIPQFTLFISLTPDNLLEKTMKLSSDQPVRVISFFPKDNTELQSVVSPPDLGERKVFQMLGSCNSKECGFAMHEEDALECLYSLQSIATPRVANILSELRNHNKLLIGCNFPDWLGRAMLRLVNCSALHGKERQEFIYPSGKDAGLTAFLTQFSPNTLEFEGQPEEFIKRLASYSKALPSAKQRTIDVPVHNKAPTVFVSYASDNLESAKRIAGILTKLGFSNVWFDKESLGGGDKWSQCIERAINEDDFFMPILSKKADQEDFDREYWKEWGKASKCFDIRHKSRRHYFLPVGIDDDKPSGNQYPNIWVKCPYFAEAQIFHAPEGALSKDDQEILKQICKDFQGGVR